MLYISSRKVKLNVLPERRNYSMKNVKSTISVLLIAVLSAGALLITGQAAAASDMHDAQAIVDKARVTFNDFMHDSHYSWLHENLKDARGLLIFPEVLKAGFILGGSGGTGVLVLRDEKSCNWSEPAFYTIGSVTFGAQIGGEAAEVVMMVMSQKAVDSLFASSVKLGGDASFAIGPEGEGAKANITADFISFAKAKGAYVGLNLEGSFVKVRDGLNGAYYGYDRDLRPIDIVTKRDFSNKGADELLATLKRVKGLCAS
jgi:lipid-binding SYLF domain-containing protein